MAYPSDEEIRARAVKRVKQRMEFYQHVVIYIAVNVLLWAIWLFTGAGGFPWPIFPTFGWGIGVVANAAEVFFSDNSESAIQREIERERRRIYGTSDVMLEKPKRQARLSDDGEIVYEDEVAEDDEPRRRARRS